MATIEPDCRLCCKCFIKEMITKPIGQNTKYTWLEQDAQKNHSKRALLNFFNETIFIIFLIGSLYGTKDI